MDKAVLSILLTRTGPPSVRSVGGGGGGCGRDSSRFAEAP